MKLKITKVCEGIFDTDIERERIAKAFKKYPKIREQLTKLVDAIEERNWDNAYQLVTNEWWQGYDDDYECSRLEFIGFLRLKDPDIPEQVPLGFEYGMTYLDLIMYMNSHDLSKMLNVEPSVNLKGK